MLRRGLCAMLGFCLTFTCACHSQGADSSSPVTTGFSCEADIRYQDMSLQGSLSRSSAGTLSITFSQPETLNGVTVEWTGETVKASLHGLSFELPPDALPAGALGGVLTDALDAALRTPTEGRLTQEGWQWEGTGQSGEITILSDPADGYLLSLEVPEIPLSVSFSNFEQTKKGNP